MGTIDCPSQGDSERLFLFSPLLIGGIKSLAHIDLRGATKKLSDSIVCRCRAQRFFFSYADTHRSTIACRHARTQPALTLKHMQTAWVPDWFGPVRQTGWWEEALKPLGPPLCRMVRAEEPQRCHSAVNPRTHWDKQTKTDRESMYTTGICGLESVLSWECQLHSYIVP